MLLIYALGKPGGPPLTRLGLLPAFSRQPRTRTRTASRVSVSVSVRSCFKTAALGITALLTGSKSSCTALYTAVFRPLAPCSAFARDVLKQLLTDPLITSRTPISGLLITHPLWHINATEPCFLPRKRQLPPAPDCWRQCGLGGLEVVVARYACCATTRRCWWFCRIQPAAAMEMPKPRCRKLSSQLMWMMCSS